MSDTITIRGFVATEIKSSTTPGGVATASFRIGTTSRRYDKESGLWADGHTNWLIVPEGATSARHSGTDMNIPNGLKRRRSAATSV